MRIATSTLFFWEYPILKILDIFKEIGLKCIEFFPENPDFWDNRFNIDYLCEVIKELKKFEIAVHNPHIELNPSSLNPYVREGTLKETLWAIDLANNLNSRILTIHPGRRPVSREPTEEEYEHFYRYLKNILEYSKDKDLFICMENMPKKIYRIGWKVEDIDNILKRFDNLYLTLDFAHAKNYANIFVEKFNKKIKHVHISGVKNGKDHYPLKYSEIDVLTPLKKLLDYGYRGIITLELDDRRIKEHSKEYKIKVLLEDIELLESII
ncbi:sugar phosphate isomerase/epimerase family protein [Methanocaldococcus indicus]|uniref:sugar phosphate isomerase/epimerase family protein n=1 Tax=Methanocaldococcus indicus TaxID=213231 RepID=UPI003C6D1F70